ncbi:MAG: hypothetical protein H6766_06240 [Candidatus Peribacteria bacterium]|nr:MAG: hypothetical protein H6766_06240 [Candidatus Peribacteria bacterium]
MEMRPQLPPIQKTSNYAKEVPLYPNTSSSTLPHIEQYTADQLEAIARMKRVQEDDEDSGRYIDYGETG